ncbi:hypothetical protein [Xanthobacter flavus]|uniref:hypothetical protein n=1 Tax=Xanthobacter flavus TaxID=281 RepID=UPI00372D2923
MLLTDTEPKDLDVEIPSGERIQSWFGGKHKYAACEAYGRAAGLASLAVDKSGAPPQ